MREVVGCVIIDLPLIQMYGMSMALCRPLFLNEKVPDRPRDVKNVVTQTQKQGKEKKNDRRVAVNTN